MPASQAAFRCATSRRASHGHGVDGAKLSPRRPMTEHTSWAYGPRQRWMRMQPIRTACSTLSTRRASTARSCPCLHRDTQAARCQDHARATSRSHDPAPGSWAALVTSLALRVLDPPCADCERPFPGRMQRRRVHRSVHDRALRVLRGRGGRDAVPRGAPALSGRQYAERLQSYVSVIGVPVSSTSKSVG